MRAVLTAPRGVRAFEQRGRKVAFGKRRDDDHDRFARVFRTTADVDRRGDGRAGGDADRNPFEARHQSRSVESRLVADDDDLVNHAAIEMAGTKPAPMP